MLAESIAQGRGAEEYNWRWQRDHGGLLAGAILFCRFSNGLTLEELRELLRAGFMGAEMARQTLVQHPPRPVARELPELARAIATKPALAARMLPVISRMISLEALYRRYPKKSAARGRWLTARARLAGRLESSDPYS